MINENLKELPEKWWIKTDKESNDIICDYYDKVTNLKTDRTIGNYYGIHRNRPELSGYMHYSENISDYFLPYCEISFKQFKKWVLKEHQLERGKFYEITYSDKPDYRYLVTGNNGLKTLEGINLHNKTYFSTNVFSARFVQIKDASAEDIRWLMACVNDERYIPKEELLIDKTTRPQKSKIELQIGEHYEITSKEGIKELVEIIAIHTDIRAMNELLSDVGSNWIEEHTACIYQTKHISLDYIVDENNNRFNYFSDDSYLAKSARHLLRVKPTPKIEQIFIKSDYIPELDYIPEYVELLAGWDDRLTGKIFKTSDRCPVENRNWSKTWTWEYLLTEERHKKYFKSSTKEAFNKQLNSVEQFIIQSSNLQHVYNTFVGTYIGPTIKLFKVNQQLVQIKSNEEFKIQINSKQPIKI